MKLHCECGNLITDSTDSLPWKANLLPDQEWFAVLDMMDDIIEKVASGGMAAEAGMMALRGAHGSATRTAWQCAHCGRLMVEDHDHQIHQYVPATGGDSREVLRSRPGAV